MADTRRRASQPKRRGRGSPTNRTSGGPSSGRNRGQADSYRPRQQQNGNAPSRSDFTFTSNTQGPRFPPASAVERGASRNNSRGYNNSQGINNFHSGVRNSDSGPPGYRGVRRRAPNRFQAPHERALLQTRDDHTEHFLGVDQESKKFRDLADLSDDEEAEMDVGTDNTDGDDAARAKTKISRTQSSNRADGDSVPKWCNPDPYIVLPPPEETTGKRIDFVKLIRKAKNDIAEPKDANNAVAANDDFISFGDDDAGAPEPPVVPGETASRAQPLQGSLNDVAATASLAYEDNRSKYTVGAAGLPVRPEHRPEHGPNSKKRKHADDRFYGSMKDDWKPKYNMDPAPWAIRKDYDRLRNDPYKLLHNEIMDFEEFVAPTEHDAQVRMDLIRRVQSVVGRDFQGYHGAIRCFGSFPVGLYLPTADMDLVYVTDIHFGGGAEMLRASSTAMFRLAEKLKTNRQAKATQVIAKAKVPIIKFVDPTTNLPVDISFENMSGVVAQATLTKWKYQHGEHFSCLVVLTKQLLEMYNLNDNGTGGLGGLSICCLVVSFFQQNHTPENLGEAFIKFLDYYGNKFNYKRYRIVVEPKPELVRKGTHGIDGRPEREDRLSIQDPNNSRNNISGGSFKAEQVLELFSWAHGLLVERMQTISMDSMRDLSILESIMGGDYSKYQDQRARMQNIEIK